MQAAALIVIVIAQSSPAQETCGARACADVLAGAFAQAARRVLGGDAKIQTRVASEDPPDEQSANDANGVDGVVELSFATEASKARVHCYLSKEHRWVDREISFGERRGSLLRETLERGRLLGFAVATMLTGDAEAETTSDTAPTPEPAPLQLDLDPLPADPPFDPEATQPISLEEMDDADPDDPRSGDTIEDDGTGDDDGDGDTEDDAAARARAPMLHERLRGLTLVQQLKVAHTGEMQERILLERIYGKTVWEALLRNPRLTGQEVARIARMGALPRTLLETIVSNGGWLQIPEVRRALLTHPRLGVDQITRILRLLPKHELKLATAQTAYSLAVREHARRLLRG